MKSTGSCWKRGKLFSMLNALSIDVEDYFQVSAFERCVNRKEWDRYPLRVGINTRRILDILDGYGVKATFFVLGWVAERCPSLISEISKEGHEIASHGFGHQRVYNQTRIEFRDDIRRSKALLEDITGQQVNGYRAPSYSISPECLWAFDELVDAGYLYDSSVFPIRHDLYGIPDWPRYPFSVSKDTNGNWGPSAQIATLPHSGHENEDSKCIREIPITTLSVCGKNIPISGGGYFRLFPYFFTRWGLSRINRIEKRPFVFYLHPWEFDPCQPRFRNSSFKSRFRHYLNLRKTEPRFRRMLADFRFSSIRNTFYGSESYGAPHAA
jgi:polysaccharide deacetylase family protein (PEP-CTERM system associated)